MKCFIKTLPGHFFIFASLLCFVGGCGFFPQPASTAHFKVMDPDLSYGSHDSQIHPFSPLERRELVDILFVVDTSYSMVPYLRKVDQSFQNFIPKLSPIAWKIAFTNADYDPNAFSYYGRNLFNGRVMKLEWNGSILPYNTLSRGVNSNEEIFIDTLKRYEKGDVSRFLSHQHQYVNPCDLPPYCQGRVRTPVHSLISAFSANKQLFRRRADFVAVIFTNGDDMYGRHDTASILMREFRKHQGREKKISIYSISIIPGDEKCFSHDRAHQYDYALSEYGEKVHEVVRVTGGKTMSICSENYSPIADEIVLTALKKKK